MTARDDLAAEIESALDLSGLYPHARPSRSTVGLIADHLFAAGWSRPRVVNTAAELDALPEDSVVLSPLFTQGRMRWRTSHQKAFGEWHRPGSEVAAETGEVLSNGPVTVLWSPPVESGEAGR